MNEQPRPENWDDPEMGRKNEWDALTEEKTELEDFIEKLQETIASLEESKKEIRGERASLIGRLDQLQAAREDSTERGGETAGGIRALTEEIENKEKEGERVDTMLETAQEKMNEKISRRDDITERMNQLEREIG